jgi:hypothetical protein
MPGELSLSIEELVRRYNVVEAPIAALDLESGMVSRIGGKLRIVIAVSYENNTAGPMAVIETVDGLERLGCDLLVDVWHMNGEPFFVELPPEEIGAFPTKTDTGSSTPPIHDAACVLPLWRTPDKLK